ncbi:MAG: hypothetical protein NTZ78_14545 [Candidatus Aureabacteria bacterium]|nr:hypothetical protein [Candidatus Auribacterota bacterium]
MKTLVTCFVSCVSILVLSLTAQSADQTKWSQPVETTYPAGQISQAAPRPAPLQAENDRAADDWLCTDGASIVKIVWWGDYHPGNMDSPNPSPIPTPQPSGFWLRQFKNNATDPANTTPGDLITEVQIPLEKCNQTYVTSVNEGDDTYPRWIHIYSYEAVLDTPWTQTKDSIYWLSIQAVFAEPPINHWEWLNTPPEDFLGTGVISYDGGTIWQKAEYYSGPYVGMAFNYAFQLLPATFSPFNLKLGNAVLSTSGTLVLSADITVKGTSYAGVQCLPYIAVTVGSAQNFVLSGNKIAAKMTPYSVNGKGKNRYYRLSEDILNLPIASIAFTGLAKGQYPIQAALLDSRGAVMGQIAERTLTIE